MLEDDKGLWSREAGGPSSWAGTSLSCSEVRGQWGPHTGPEPCHMALDTVPQGKLGVQDQDGVSSTAWSLQQNVAGAAQGSGNLSTEEEGPLLLWAFY